MVYKIITFRAKNGEYCWRAIARNGRELFRASETYKNKYYNRKQADIVSDACDKMQALYFVDVIYEDD